MPTDSGGRYFYVREEDGTFWAPSFNPVKAELDSFECRHGLGYTKITGVRNGLAVETTFFVPLGFTAEVHRVRVKNTGTAPRTFKLFSYLEFCLWNAYDDMTNYQRNWSTGEVEVEPSTIYHKTEYRERRDHFAFSHVNAPTAGFDTDRETFVGLYNGLHEPEVVVRGESGGSVASGWQPIASHCLAVTLAPGEEKTFVFTLGYVENPVAEKWEKPGVINKTRAKEMIASFSTAAQVDAALATLSDQWSKLLSTYAVTSSDEKLNRMVNIWNPYQCMVTFNMSRSASYFETGIGRGMGFRDSNQDLLGFVHLVPERARERIIDIASTQFADGSAYHQYQPLTKRGNNDVGSGFNDDPFWLIFGVAAYIRETGDFGILEEQVPFDNDSYNKATLFEHLKRSFHHVLNNLGPHRLPLIGRADWNDCLNLNCFSETPDESFQTTGNRKGRTAESVFIAGMFVGIAPGLRRTSPRTMGFADEATLAKRRVRQDVRSRAQARVGRRVVPPRVRLFRQQGRHARSTKEGKIFIEPQGFCVMAGIGVKDGPRQEGARLGERATRYPYGIVLNNPPYTTYHVELGEISLYPPGYKENAGIFCHNNPWVMIAETRHRPRGLCLGVLQADYARVSRRDQRDPSHSSPMFTRR